MQKELQKVQLNVLGSIFSRSTRGNHVYSRRENVVAKYSIFLNRSILWHWQEFPFQLPPKIIIQNRLSKQLVTMGQNYYFASLSLKADLNISHFSGTLHPTEQTM